MKLVRYRAGDDLYAGLIDRSGRLRRCFSTVRDEKDRWTVEDIADLSIMDPQSLPPERLDVSMLHPVVEPGQIVSAPLNGMGRSQAMGLLEASEPHVTLRSQATLAGDSDPPPDLRNSGQFEAGLVLGMLLGSDLEYATEQESVDALIGFVMGVEIIDLGLQSANPLWNATRGANLPRSVRLSPVLLTKDEVDDPRLLALWLDIDHQRYQEMALSSLEFPPHLLISYISSCFPLKAGDLILTSGPPAKRDSGATPGLGSGQRLSFGCHGMGESHLTVTIG